MTKLIADQEKLELLANFLINARGYLVVGLVTGEYSIGRVVKNLWGAQVEQPLRVIAITNKTDWKAQLELAKGQFDDEFKRNFYNVQPEFRESSCYYKVITD